MTQAQMSNAHIGEVIAVFTRDLKNSLDMADKRQAVRWMADVIGVEKANAVADVFGLSAEYYKAKAE